MSVSSPRFAKVREMIVLGAVANRSCTVNGIIREGSATKKNKLSRELDTKPCACVGRGVRSCRRNDSDEPRRERALEMATAAPIAKTKKAAALRPRLFVRLAAAALRDQ